VSDINDMGAWIERLGGWAVVLIIVRWMMSRIDRLLEGFLKALDQFQIFENEERRTHRAIVETQERILAELQRLRLENGVES
jgi:hypothetical protein